jgi:hypothetical protein
VAALNAMLVFGVDDPFGGNHRSHGRSASGRHRRRGRGPSRLALPAGGVAEAAAPPRWAGTLPAVTLRA